MGRRQTDSEPTRWVYLTLLLMGLVSCSLVYMFMSAVLRPTSKIYSFSEENLAMEGGGGVEGCCRGIEGLELWGAAVKWGTDFKFNSSVECCEACKKMCSGTDGPCLCDSWVFCGNREACGSKFGEAKSSTKGEILVQRWELLWFLILRIELMISLDEILCWLKKQKDTLAPERQEAVKTVSWTSGLIFGRGEGIVGLETEYGTLHIKLLPDCAPHSVTYILELLGLRHCAGCQIYRAESRGQSWDSEGNHIKDASFGPPFALIQGTLETHATTFNKIPTEACPLIRRGSVAWVGSGPEFFISLANHEEWKRSYTVFGYVLPEDMVIAEKIAALPTRPDVWNNINVSVLEKSVPLWVRRIKTSHGANVRANSVS